MTLVDTNVLPDIATNDRDWAEWSVSRLDAAAIGGPLPISAVSLGQGIPALSAQGDTHRVLPDLFIGAHAPSLQSRY